MKLLEEYESPEMEILLIDDDVITASIGTGIPGDGEDWDPLG